MSAPLRDDTAAARAVEPVLHPGGLALLDSLPPYEEADALRRGASLREAGHSADLVSAVLTQSRLRARAREKFGEFADSMLFTPDGLEQATRLPGPGAQAVDGRALRAQRRGDLADHAGAVLAQQVQAEGAGRTGRSGLLGDGGLHREPDLGLEALERGEEVLDRLVGEVHLHDAGELPGQQRELAVHPAAAVLVDGGGEGGDEARSVVPDGGEHVGRHVSHTSAPRRGRPPEHRTCRARRCTRRRPPPRRPR